MFNPPNKTMPFQAIDPLPIWATATSQGTQTETTTPKRLNITVKVTEPDDLKIGEGSLVKTFVLVGNWN